MYFEYVYSITHYDIVYKCGFIRISEKDLFVLGCTKGPYGYILVYTCAYKFTKYIPVNIRLLEYVFVSILQGIEFIQSLLVVSE